ncbi:RYamide receptor-like [Bradysia coprophila]|uniref:RYamide receptor-like n=1 Tax=Bradysia coprophila TaxID=38358 RepID=UPI00187DC166|nr:RYamide receptor-like [Bradysia coprophila]
MNETANVVKTTVKPLSIYKNETVDDEDSLLLHNIVYMCAYSLTGILALFGNIVVVYVVFRLPKMRTFVHILLANMAVSDIMCALSFFTGLILCSDSTINSAGHNGFCVTNKAIQLLTFQVTSFTMTVIALDRWLSVFFPFRHTKVSRQNQALVKVIVGIWIGSLVIILGTSPSLAYQRYFNFNGPLIKCEISKVFQVSGSTLESERVQLMIANVAHFWLPLGVITGAYGSIALRVWKRKLGDDLTQSQLHLIIVQKWKTIKMLIATVVVFVACWLPFFIYNFITFKSDGSKKRPCNQNLLFLLVIWIAFSSCCSNPLVYWIYNETYRNGIVMVLQLLTCKKSSMSSLDINSSKTSSARIKSVTLI